MNLDFCTYDKENDIHYIDYSGKIDLQTGLTRIEYLEAYFKSYQKSGTLIKVLLDASWYQKYSPEVHDELARIARSIFFEKFEVKLAVIDANYECQLSDIEAWFKNKNVAIDWLLE